MLIKKFVVVFILFISSYLFAQSKPNVIVVATGGGISGTLNEVGDTSFTVGNLTIEAILDQIPELNLIANVKGEQLVNIASQEMSIDIWRKLAKRVQQLVDKPEVDGIVITHGTDTLEETAYFLNLVIKTNKPIVLTGATRPFGQLSSDGPGNLFDAILVASNPTARSKGVFVTFSGNIFSAREVSKGHTYRTDPFITYDLGMLGYVHGNNVYIYQISTRKHTYQSEFNINDLDKLKKVDIVFSHIDQNPRHISTSVLQNAQGIIVAGVGNGNVKKSVLSQLKKVSDDDIVVVRSSRTGNGLVTRGAEIDDIKHGFVTGDNLSPQKARILLMLALTKTNDSRVIQRIFNTY